MGIKGAAAGTITGSAFGILILLLAYFSGANRRNFSVMDSFRLDWNIMKSIFRFGTPAGLEFFLSFTAFYALILIFHAGGPVSAAASTIVFNWDHVSFVPLLGIEIAVTSLVGRYVGAGDMDTVYKTVKSGIKTGWAYSVLIFVLFVFFPASLTDFFKPSPPDDIFINARPLSIFMIQVAAVYVIVEAQMVVLAGALRGAGDTFVTMLITVSLHWILVLILYVVMFPLGFGPKAGWAVVVLLFLMFPLLLYFRFRSGKWKNIKID
jgi:MATE family multidrug resistance protein